MYNYVIISFHILYNFHFTLYNSIIFVHKFSNITNFKINFLKNKYIKTSCIVDYRTVKSFFPCDRTRYTQREGWASKEAASDLEKQRFYLGQTIDDKLCSRMQPDRKRRVRFYSIEIDGHSCPRHSSFLYISTALLRIRIYISCYR